MAEEQINKDTTELKIIITEDRNSGFDVDYMANIKGSDVVIPLRASHVIGQLLLAAIVIAIRTYKSLSDKTASALQGSNSSGKGKKSGKGQDS